MKHTTTWLAALLLGLVISTVAPAATLAQGQPGSGADAASHSPLVADHRAAQRYVAVLTASTGEEPLATYGMITLSYFEVISNEHHLGWERIRFLEDNLLGYVPKFAYPPAPQG